MAETSENRVVFQRSSEYRFFRVIGIGIYSASFLFLLWSIYFGYDWLIWSTTMGVLILSLRWFLISLRETFRRIVFLQDYLAFNSWILLPHVYPYGQIAFVETVEHSGDLWTIEPETYVKVVFNDGKVLKVQESLVSVRKFRKLLRERSGKTFRKPSKKKKITK